MLLGATSLGFVWSFFFPFFGGGEVLVLQQHYRILENT